jgi:hypothetical protein
MGRPIKKKFFANLNSPYQDHATGGPTGEGGESVVSVTVNTTGTYTASLPTVTFGDPDLFSGEPAEATVHGKALSAVATAAGSGYSYGNTLTQNVSSGNTGTHATWNVTALKTVTLTILDDGTAVDPGDEYTFSGSYDGGSWTTPLRVRIDTGTGGNAATFTVITPGVWSGAAAPTTTTGATLTQVAAGSDFNGSGLQFNITSWGVAEVAVATEGDYTAITSAAKATTASPAGGTGATLTITYGVKSIEVTDGGSNYISAADAAVTFSAGAAAATSVLGNVRDNGLAAYAYIIDGTEGVLVDIMKQESSRRYLVKEDSGAQGQCRLVASNAGDLDPGEMCLIATDTEGCTYFVTKLTARRAYLTQRTSAGAGYRFADGTSAGWNITGAVTGRVSLATV